MADTQVTHLPKGRRIFDTEADAIAAARAGIRVAARAVDGVIDILHNNDLADLDGGALDRIRDELRIAVQEVQA